MSLSALMSRDENIAGGEATGGPRIPLLKPDGDAPYAVWVPQLHTHMMRVGIDDRYYREPIEGWATLVATVGTVAASGERDALSRLLGTKPKAATAVAETKDEPDTDASSSGGKPPKPAASKVSDADRKMLTHVVAQSRKAYGILYAAIGADLRQLIASVPQGYAFGLWSLLEERFQSRKDDNIADVWTRYINFAMMPGESYERYMARVDQDTELLKLAKQPPHTGLRKVILLYRLQPMYDPARLALQSAKVLDKSDEIDWMYVKSYMLDFERDQARSNGSGAGTDANGRAMSARTTGMSYSQATQKSNGGESGSNAGGRDYKSSMECWNCNEAGHFSYDCKKPRKQQQGAKRGGFSGRGSRSNRNRAGKRGNGGSKPSYPSEDDEDAMSVESANSVEHVFTVVNVNRFSLLPSDDELNDESDGGHNRVCAASSNDKPKPSAAAAVSGKTPDAATAAKIAALAEKKKLKSAEREAKLKAAVIAENKEAAELRRESLERAKHRATNPLDKALKAYSWGVDSMASLHVTGNRTQLTDVRRCPAKLVKVADGGTITVMHKGNTQLVLKVIGEDRNIRINVSDVYWHESFDANLLSWGVLRAEGWTLHSSKDGTRVTTPSGSKVAASTEGRLTTLETAKKPERVYAAKRLSVGRVVCATADDLVRLHERLGHVGFARLLDICRAGRTDGVGSIKRMGDASLEEAKKRITECAACLQGKMTRPEFGSRGLDKGQHPGDVLHVDTAHIKLPDGADGRKCVQHWLIATDPFSEGRFSAVVDTKDEIASALIGIITRLQSMTGKRLRLLYCDNGSEFMNRSVRDFCRTNGTQLDSPPANTPELRGVAERGVRSFKDGARTMLIHCGAPQQMIWAYAAGHQAYLWNRTRIAKATGKTPLEAIGGRTPSVLHTGVFGCDAWVHQGKASSTSRNTFDPKATPGVYLGHDDHQHGALVRLLTTGKVIRTRDVELREDSFKHMQALRTGRQISAQAYSAPQGADAADSDSTTHAESKSGAETDDDWEVERIIDKETTPSGTRYLIKWVDSDETTWEPAGNLKDAPKVVEAYERQHRELTPTALPPAAEKPAPPPSRILRSAMKSISFSEESKEDEEPRGSVSAVMSVLAALGDCSRL